MTFKAGDKVLFADPETVPAMYFEVTQARLINENGKGPFTIRDKEDGLLYLEEIILYNGTEEKTPFMPSRFILAAQKEKPKNHCWML